ncbi:MAG: hypothetical protein HKN45_05435 [Flavobacteriales bacterium]|nr:hypothetical protein [Flavobacteriales bacterium]
MIHRLMCLMLLCGWTLSYAQNLIPNPSFEDTICSGESAEHPGFFALEHWYNINLGSPDKYTSLVEDVPCTFVSIYSPSLLNSGEWQFPKEGENMVGLWHGDQSGIGRELISSPLNSPLLADSDYCFSMYVSLGNRFDLAIDKLGAYFSVDSVYDYGTSGAPDLPLKVLSPPGIFYTDTTEWVLVEGVYTAQGGEEFIILGNALDDSQTSYITVEGGGLNIAYYFIDDVQLVPCNSTGTAEYNLDPTIEVAFLDQGRLRIKGQIGVKWSLFDIGGRLTGSGELKSEQANIQLPGLTSSVYLFHWEFNGQSGTEKLSNVY